MRAELSLGDKSFILDTMTRHELHPRRGRRRRTAVVVGTAVAALLLGAAGCSGDDDDDASGEETTTTQPPQTAAATELDRPDAGWQISVAQWTGGIDQQRRPAISRGIQNTLASWVDGGFGGDYPRSDFAAGFADWTTDAARQGRTDRFVTTNAALGPELVDQVADERRATVSVFAVDGVLGGATARLRLRFTGQRSSGDLVVLTVTGQVRLTHAGDRWRIFGYDLDRMVEAR